MVVPAAALVSLEEYLATSYEPDCDFVDGVLEERNVGKRDHSDLQSAIDTYLRNRKQQWRTRTYVELRVQVSATRVRIPDICLVSRDTEVDEVLAQPPLVCIEVLSPDDRMIRVERRINDYLQMGVPCVWVFDPVDRTVLECTRTGRRVVSESVLKLAGTPVEINLPELFADLD
jgi:Uma2 family endonuclease